MAVNTIVEWFSRDLVPENCHRLESSAVYTVPPFLFESLPGHSNRTLSRLQLHMHAERIIPPVLTSNIHIGRCLPNALTQKPLRSYEMF